jgi:hypothetical protein
MKMAAHIKRIILSCSRSIVIAGEAHLYDAGDRLLPSEQTQLNEIGIISSAYRTQSLECDNPKPTPDQKAKCAFLNGLPYNFGYALPHFDTEGVFAAEIVGR